MTAAPEPARTHVVELDGLRGIAIVLVMLYHFFAYNGDGVIGRTLTEITSRGWAGVDVFFALSGFLITGILVDARREPRYFRDFYVRRSLRIFPLYYAVMTLLVVVGLAAAAWDLPFHDPALRSVDRAWINYLYLTNFALAFQGSNYVPMDIAWSLAIEEQFYLLFPFLVRWTRDRPLLWILVAACLVAPVFRYVAFVTADLSEWAAYAPYALPHCRMDNLAVGGIAALVVRGGSAGLRAAIGRAALPLWIAAAVVHALWDRTDTAFVISGYSVVGAATAATIVLLLQGRSPRLAAVLRNRPLVYIGKISYGLYLLHLFVRAGSSMGPVGPISASLTENAALAVVRTALLIAVSIAVAGISFQLFERPILRLKDRLAPRAAPEPGRDYLAEDEPRAGMPA